MFAAQAPPAAVGRATPRFTHMASVNGATPLLVPVKKNSGLMKGEKLSPPHMKLVPWRPRSFRPTVKFSQVPS